MYSIEALNILQEWFAKLPGIGPKSAARLAYRVIEMDPAEVKQFAQDMYAARLAVRHCAVCGNLTDRERELRIGSLVMILIVPAIADEPNKADPPPRITSTRSIMLALFSENFTLIFYRDAASS